MALTDATIPADTESVKLGASRIRDFKTDFNNFLGALLNDDGTVKNASIPLAALAAAITAAQIADNTITAAKIQQVAFGFAAGAFATGNYTVTLSPVPAAYVTGLVVRFSADLVNTGATTVNVNALGAKTIKKFGSTDLVAGDIAAGQLVELIYDGTNFQMVSPWTSLVPVVRDSEAKAWVKFDGRPALTTPGFTTPTWTTSNNVDLTTSVSMTVQTGQGVGVYSSGTYPTHLAANTRYFARRASANSYQLYDTAAHAISSTGASGQPGQIDLSGGTGAFSLLACTINAQFNVTDVVPFLSQGADFSAYYVYFTNPMPHADYATTATGKSGTVSGFGFMCVDQNDASLTTRKQISPLTINGSVQPWPEVSATFFAAT